MLQPWLTRKNFGDASRILEALHKTLAIIEFDVEGRILRANAAFCALMGYSAEELRGQHHRIFVERAYGARSAYVEFWRRLRDGKPHEQLFKRLAKGGREVWIQGSYNPVLDSGGRIIKFVKVAMDVTAATQRSAEQSAKVEAISRVQAIVEFTPEGEILTANDNFLNALGYSLEEIRGKHHRMFVEPAEAASRDYGVFWERLRAGEFCAREFHRIGKGGRDVWIQASYNPIFDPQGRITRIVKFATDVTPRVRSVQAIAAGLGQLAQGDLRVGIDTPLTPELESLRIDFNDALESLRRLIAEVISSVRTIDARVSEISSSSG